MAPEEADVNGGRSVKGVAVRAGLRWVAEQYGIETVEKVYEKASPALREIIVPGLTSFGIVSSNWYDSETLGELIELVLLVAAPPDPKEHTRRLAAAVAIDNVQGVYNSLLKLIATRSLVVIHAHRVWRSYFDGGHLVVTSPRVGELAISVRHANPPAVAARAYHHTVCELTSLVIEQILLRVGYRGATLERKRCVARGADECAFEVDYVE